MESQLGFIMKLEGNRNRILALEKLLTAKRRIKRKEQKFIEKKGQRKLEEIAEGLRRSIVTLFTSLEKVIPCEYTTLFSAEAMRKIASDSSAISRITDRYFEELTKKEELTTSGDYLIALRILRGLGLVEVLFKGGGKLAGLTELGRVIKEYLASSKGLSNIEKLNAMLLASLSFSTKMRVVYGLYYMYGPDYAGFYATLRDKLFTYDPNTKVKFYDGMEKLGLEVLYEIVLTKAGESKLYVSETQMLVKLLEGFLKLFDEDKFKLNELFRSINKYLRYPYYDKFPYESAAWEALTPGSYLELDDALEKYKFTKLKPLIEKLRKEFTPIEYQLRGLYGLPPKY
jgi:hypothetical protein